jgi:hypothetical protein
MKLNISQNRHDSSYTAKINSIYFVDEFISKKKNFKVSLEEFKKYRKYMISKNYDFEGYTFVNFEDCVEYNISYLISRLITNEN